MSEDVYQAFAARVLWQVEQGQERAELRLEPPSLGRMAIRVDVDGERLALSIQVQQGAAREALENALPRLREMVAEQGLSLGDVDISGGEGESGAGAAQGEGAPQPGPAHAGESAESGSAPLAVPDRLFDGYA